MTSKLDQELATRKADGIAISCASSPAIDATYALDDRTLATVGSIARDVASGLDFPAGATTYDYPDIEGTPHTFTEPQWVALYKAMRDLNAALVEQANVMRAGDASARVAGSSRPRSRWQMTPGWLIKVRSPPSIPIAGRRSLVTLAWQNSHTLVSPLTRRAWKRRALDLQRISASTRTGPDDPATGSTGTNRRSSATSAIWSSRRPG